MEAKRTMETQRPQPHHLLFLLAFCILVPTTASHDLGTEFIRRRCEATPSPDRCFNSLSMHGKEVQQNFGKLVRVAVSVSISEVQSAIMNLTRLSRSGSDTPEGAALRDCYQYLNDAVVAMKSSLKQMGHVGDAAAGSSDFQMTNVMAWMGMAHKKEEACTAAFDGVVDKAHLKANVCNVVNEVMKLTVVASKFVHAYMEETRLQH